MRKFLALALVGVAVDIIMAGSLLYLAINPPPAVVRAPDIVWGQKWIAEAHKDVQAMSGRYLALSQLKDTSLASREPASRRP